MTASKRRFSIALRAVGGHGVVAAGAQRVASRQSSERQQAASQCAVPLESLGGVGGARREKTTGAGKQVRERELVDSNEGDEDPPGRHRPRPARRLRAARKSASIAENGASTSSGLGMTTRSTP